MDRLLHCMLLCQALSSSGAIFVDTNRPIVFQNEDPSFGHQVVQMDKWVIVSAPLRPQSQNKTGQLYRCNPKTATCNPMSIPGSSDDINFPLGLALAVQENPTQLLLCGADPTEDMRWEHLCERAMLLYNWRAARDETPTQISARVQCERIGHRLPHRWIGEYCAE
ncbi:unnamed protein product [Staurois parvus]|uniref:Uncharacterized protein n=1 Tax=Staurois parvus TaxID=386267 RepID=A0ABN9FXP8_9NEOB|nr:unnamed protein product [Staurois parvus]